ncbi:MAG TPA: hypothetical protein VE973_00945 [Candidatus Limnocylindria bacterium]|nr:hypothetical protein [Candidatus Limnocylindria bacterium]
MENLPPQPPLTIWETNPKLKSLLVVLIVILLISGIGLQVFSIWSQNYKQKVYEETVNGLPKHKIPVATSTPLTNTTEWKAYKNDEYGFELEYPSYYVTTGKQAINSSLGYHDLNVGGVFIGPFVFVRLTTEALKQRAVAFFSGPESEVQTVPNSSAQIKYIYLTGDGGPAYYAYIHGATQDIFVDGYSCGFDTTCDVYGYSTGGQAKQEDLKKILSTFKFTK